MKSKLKLISTKDMSQDDWLKYRRNGVGASEVATILGLNPYKASIQLFYEKLGEELLTVENIAMFHGKEMEPYIADLWQYWDPNEPGDAAMIRNYRDGKIIRRCQRVNAYVTNPDYPWLFVSLDRKINKTTPFTHLGGAADEGALELKTIAGYESDKWEGGIPPAHVIQVQTQLLVCEFNHGEIAALKDGRAFDVYPFEYNAGICETIIKKTRDFWERVTEARKIYTRKFEAERNFNYKAADALEAELTTLEPPVDGSEAYAKYLKERYKIAEPGEMPGTDELLIHAQKDAQLSQQIKVLEAGRVECQNHLKNFLRDGADKITFGPWGFVSWKENKNGVRTFLNKVKEK